MNNIALIQRVIPSMDADAIEHVRGIEAEALEKPQINIETIHHIHAGMYARTIFIPAGTMLTGALIKRATLLILSGNAQAFVGNEILNFSGYTILPAAAGRKQVFLAIEDTCLTMIFPSKATTIAEAESEFTDETDLLMSAHSDNQIFITGE